MIDKKYILKLEPYMRPLPTTNDLYAVVVDPPNATLERIGFAPGASEGSTILPRVVGRKTRYNAHGKRLIRRDLPKETASTTVEWHWKEWHGRDLIERSDFRDRHYQRYHRDRVSAPGLELTIFKDVNGQTVVTTPAIGNWRTNPDTAIHAINLMLEIFGECQFYDQERTAVITAPLRRLNWDVLPPGRRPFPQLAEQLRDVLRSVKEGKRSFADHRLDEINKYGPDFTAVGRAGFRGYVIFGFPSKDLYVLESILYGNATYVFEGGWEALSQMTKADILAHDLHRARVIHQASWGVEVQRVLDERTGVQK